MDRIEAPSNVNHSITMICRSAFIVVLVLETVPALAHNPPPRMSVVSRTVTVSVNEADDITFKPISASGGFRGTRIQQIVQDDQGFLWFGTVDGLLRYDGYGFKRFDHDPDRRNSLGGVYVRSMFKDHAGILWIGCDHFLDRFDPRTQTFTHYRVEPDEPEGLALTVSHISEDHAGVLWLSTGNGLYRFAPPTGTFTRFAHDPDDPTSLGGNDVKSSGEDRSGSFWVAAGEGLDLFDRNTGKVTARVPLQEQRRIGFYEDSQHVFWIYTTSGRGLAVLDRERNQLTRYVLEGPTISRSGQPGVSSVLEDSDGTLWFGTGNAGLFKFDRDHGEFIQYRNNRDDSQSLPANTVVPQSLIEDREGHIWVALEGALPTVFARRPSSFHRLRAGPGGGSTVTSIFEDRQRTLWIGYLGALLGVDASSGRARPYDPEGRQTFGSVQAMAEDHEGGLWAGTTRGLSRVDRRTGVLTTFHHDPQRPASLSNDRIGALLVNRDGVLWITTDAGIDRYDPAANRFTTYRALPGGGDLPQYLGMKEDGDGALWLASNYAGVHRFAPATSTFTVFLHDDNQPGSLSNNRVNSILIDHAGTIWVGTQNGLNRFDPDRKAFTAYYEKDGLSGNVVNCILEGRSGELWMSTNGGLTAFNPPTQRFRNYSVSDGLPASDLTALKPCFEASDGRMYFGGFSGAIAFYPEKVVIDSVVPSIAMTDFRVSGVPINVLFPTTAGSSSTPDAPVTLGYRQNTIGFEFSALSFFSPNTHRYRYRLEGIDPDWNEVDSTRRSVSYATLPPGTYVFRAQAAATPGVWGEPGVSLPIHILSPWWRAPWFIALLVVASAAAIWGGHRVQLRIVERRDREITALNERLMKAQEQERIRIAGELHDDVMQQMLAVTMKLGTAKRRVASDSEAKPLLDSVQEQLVAIGSGIRQLSHDLHPPILQESGLPGALRGYCEQFSAASNIPVSCEADDAVAGLSRGVALALFRIAQEALGNAAKHSDAGRITVRLSRSSSLVTLEISDNGQGFDSSSLGASGGLGLIMMRERAAQLNGTFDFESAPNHGAIITVVIPFR
jgi:signal transduction histidine kinase/ligand-binding sensor domain-containing protein